MQRRQFLTRTIPVVGGLACLLNRARADEPFDGLHREAVVVDAYSACVNLADLRKGGIDVVIQAVASEELLVRVPPDTGDGPPPPGMDVWENVFTGQDQVKRVGMSIDEQLRDIEKQQDKIALALTVEEARRIVAGGKIALFLMLMSGWINNDLDVLRMFHRRGVRVMALCHLASFDWADSSVELKDPPGLTDFGRDVVRECNKLGVLVDLSHASDETFWHAVETSKKPVVATHSNCRALSKSRRDLSDDMLVAIARTGGVASILASTARTGPERTAARLKRDRALVKNYPDPFKLAAAKREDAIVWGTKLNLKHIDHAVKTAGIDHVAIASHCTSVPQWREYTEALINHGYTRAETQKILGGNMLRLLERAIGKV